MLSKRRIFQFEPNKVNILLGKKKKKNTLRGVWRIYNLYNIIVNNVQDTIQNVQDTMSKIQSKITQHKGNKKI